MTTRVRVGGGAAPVAGAGTPRLRLGISALLPAAAGGRRLC